MSGFLLFRAKQWLTLQRFRSHWSIMDNMVAWWLLDAVGPKLLMRSGIIWKGLPVQWQSNAVICMQRWVPYYFKMRTCTVFNQTVFPSKCWHSYVDSHSCWSKQTCGLLNANKPNILQMHSKNTRLTCLNLQSSACIAAEGNCLFQSFPG